MTHEYAILTDFDTVVEVLGLLSRSKKDFSFDLETTSLRPWDGEILGIGFTWKECTGVYIPFRVRTVGLWATELKPQWSNLQEKQIISLLKDLLETSPALKAAHNAKFEWNWCSSKWGIYPKNLFCTCFYRFISDPTKGEEGNRLEDIVNENYPDLNGLKDIWIGVKKDEKGNRDLSLYHSTERLGTYCCQDTDATFRELVRDKKDCVGKPFQKIVSTRLMPAVEFVAGMTQTGFLVDREYLNEKRRQLTEERAEVLQKIQDEVEDFNFNPGSSKHVEHLFRNKWKLPCVGEGFDVNVLNTYYNKHGIDVAKDIINYRVVSKLITTYFDGMEAVIDPKTNCIHANLNLLGTETGRLSCSEPNLQNLPVMAGPVVKRMFIARPGYKLIGADYSQIELRLLAEYSEDPMLLKAYREGIDLHTLTAAIIFKIPVEKVSKFQRYIGKTANFALCYGGGAKNLVFGKRGIGNKIMGPEYAKKIGVDYENIERVIIPDEVLIAKATEIRNKYFAGYARLEPWRKEVVVKARKKGYAESAYGRVRYLPELDSPIDKKRWHAERQAVNMNPQSTASDYLLFHFMDMCKYFEAHNLDVKPLLTVHDQCVFEVREDHVDKVVPLIPILGVAPDEANIKIKMVLEPSVGTNLGEV